MRPRRSRRRCRGRQREAGLACAPALGAGGRAVSPQPPRPRLDWRLPRARLMGGRGRWRADCAPGGRRSRSAPQPGRRGGRLVRAKRDMARKPISPGGPVSTGRGYTLAGQPLASWGRAARGLHFPGCQGLVRKRRNWGSVRRRTRRLGLYKEGSPPFSSFRS